MNFASDNWAGAAPAVMSALARHNSGFEPSYGNDPISGSVNQTFNEIFERDVAVYFVATGTAANALSLAAYAKPGGVIFCHTDSHIQIDECNCPEFMTSGNKLVSVPGTNGKFTAEALSGTMTAFPYGVVHHGQVAAVSISQASESGTIYTPAEIAAIGEVAKSQGAALHMDGARFANALVSLGCTPAEMTWKAGVDVLSFGATKNGCWCAEAVVFFNPDDGRNFEFFRKRSGQLLSKSRFAAAQFEGYFDNGSWLSTARHANGMAARLDEGIRALGGKVAWPVEANEVFPILKRFQSETLKAAGARFHEYTATDWPETLAPAEDEVCFRLVASFATSEEDVETFLKAYADVI